MTDRTHDTPAALTRWQPYPAYKDTKIDWLGEIPDHWALKRLKYVMTESKEINGQNIIGEMLSVSQYYGVIPKEYDHENRKRSDEDLYSYRVVRPGQLVANTMWLNYAGLGVSDYEGYVSPAYRAYFIDPNMYGKYVHHLMRSSKYVAGYTKYLYGIRPNSLQIKTDDWHSFPVLLPPLPEQRAIAAFLDRETARLDALIAAKERLITLLQEKRAALISHAVTKGLDPDAPLRDSGVEWLGEIPAHWEVKRLKFIASVRSGVAKGRKLVLSHSGYEA